MPVRYVEVVEGVQRSASAHSIMRTEWERRMRRTILEVQVNGTVASEPEERSRALRTGYSEELDG